MESKAILSFKDYAAQVIQSWWKHLAAMRQQGDEGEEIDVKRKVFDEDSAATVIQRAWRKHNVAQDKLCLKCHVDYFVLHLGYQSLQIL